MKLTHLSLFSGIGGLDLAAEWAGFETVGQCEWADFPTKILEKHWPDVPRWRDIHELTAAAFRERTGLKTVDCISGGFPCQPHSLAGKRKASADERDLWPQMRRTIGEIKPRWVVGENVRGLLSSEDGRFFRGILRDFAEMGYDVGWCVISAAAVGAVHRRERVAIVAHANSDGFESALHEPEKGFKPRHKSCSNIDANMLHTFAFQNPPGIYRSDDGAADSVDRIKSLGNMVVPQQFYPVFKAIGEMEAKIRRNGHA